MLVLSAGRPPEGFRVKTALVLLHEGIQLGEVDVRQDRTHAAALGCTGVGTVVLPLLHVSGLQKFPHQGQELLILDSPAQDIDEDMVVKAVETRLDVALHHPAHTGEGSLNLGQRRVSTPI